MTPDELAAKMREIAPTLRLLNRLYDHNVEYGWWNPVDLDKEAKVVALIDDPADLALIEAAR